MSWCLILVLLLVTPAWGACPPVKRSQAVLRAFRKTHPCPSTGLTTGPCSTHVLDHQIPLCLTGQGGDIVPNLGWQEKQAAREKDKLEKALCRKLCACQP